MEKDLTMNNKAVEPVIPTNLPSAKPASSMTKYVAIVLAIALIAGGSFFAGMQYGKSSSNTGGANGMGAFGGQGTNGGFGGRMGQMGTFGTVTSISSTSITVSVTQGGPDQQSSDSSSSTSKTYTINSSTTVTNNGSTASVSDITNGDTVMIRTSTSDTSVAASIILNPSFGGPMGQTQSTTTDSTTNSSTSI